MSNLFKYKTMLLTPLIKFGINHPNMMQSKIFLKAMFVFPKKISKSYDLKIDESGKSYHIALDQGLTRIINKPLKILDLCTGTGFAAFKAAEFFPSAMIDAIDHVEEMITISKKKQIERDIKNICFRIDSAVKLNYKENEFDLIITSNAPIYLSEITRVLRPKGLFLVVYSFGGDAFVNAEKNIARYLESNKMELIEIKCIDNGVYILGQNK